VAVGENTVLLRELCVNVFVRVSSSVQVPVESVAVVENLLLLFCGDAVAVPVGVGDKDTLTDSGLDRVSVCDMEKVSEGSGVGVSVWLPVREMLLEMVDVVDLVRVADEAVRTIVGDVAVKVIDALRLGAAVELCVPDKLSVSESV